MAPFVTFVILPLRTFLASTLHYRTSSNSFCSIIAHPERLLYANRHKLQGHSKNPSGDSFDGVVAIFSEVLASFGDGASAFSDHTDCGVAQGCQRPCSGPDAASVLVQGHVADMMELVFDGPVVADEFKQLLGPGLV